MAWLDGFFAGKVVAVTGASSGIGRETAQAFGAAGAQVALLARRRDVLEDVATTIRERGGRALVVPVDVTERAEVRAALHEVRSHYGRIDIVVNNAGVLIPATVRDLAAGDLHAMLAVNVFGALAVMQDAVTIMEAQSDGGVIVNVDSLAGRRGVSPLGGYAATKFALVGLTEALRTELHDSRVHVALIMPGIVDTPMAEQATQSEVVRSLWPAMFDMSPAWVVWAIFAAVRFRLVELAVPPGAGTLEKLAALTPGLTDSLIHWGTSFSRWLSGNPGPDSPADSNR